MQGGACWTTCRRSPLYQGHISACPSKGLPSTLHASRCLRDSDIQVSKGVYEAVRCPEGLFPRGLSPPLYRPLYICTLLAASISPGYSDWMLYPCTGAWYAHPQLWWPSFRMKPHEIERHLWGRVMGPGVMRPWVQFIVSSGDFLGFCHRNLT